MNKCNFLYFCIIIFHFDFSILHYPCGVDGNCTHVQIVFFKIFYKFSLFYSPMNQRYDKME